MWHRVDLICGLILGLLLAQPGSGLALDVSGKLKGTVRWSGDIRLTGPVEVPAGATLAVSAGTRVTAAAPDFAITVHGRMLVEGTKAQPVRFATPQGWRGLHFFETGEKSAILHAHFENAEEAVSVIAARPDIRNCRFRNCTVAVKLLREAVVEITDSLFENNEIGIDSEMRSRHVIRGNRFLDHRKSAIIASNNAVGPIEKNVFEGNAQGIGVTMPHPAEIADNQFRRNEVGIFCNQTQNSPVIRGNSFEEGGMAIVNYSFSYPVVEQNRIVGHKEGLRSDQFGSAKVQGNLFRGNGTALYLYRKSNAVVRGNLIEQNELAIYCDYSSYPEVRDNNFSGNAMAVKLGIYQSADWEKRSGSKRLIQEEAERRNSRNPLLAKAPETFTDVVDVSGNWWGKETELLNKLGKDANLPFFHDRRDQPKVRYEGFGPGEYALDRIVYAPWLTAPAAYAGPR